MKRRTDILVPLFERVFKTNKTFTKRTIMLKLQKIAPELEVTDDEIRNTINILMQRGTIERDYDKKKGDSKGAVYKVVDVMVLDAIKKSNETLSQVKVEAENLIRTNYVMLCEFGLNYVLALALKRVTCSNLE